MKLSNMSLDEQISLKNESKVINSYEKLHQYLATCRQNCAIVRTLVLHLSSQCFIVRG